MLTYLGNPDMDFAQYAMAHGVDAENVEDPGELKAAIKRGIESLANGKPYLLSVRAERWGGVGDYSFHPDISIADMRSRKV